jgi:NIMA (never in mitosis gene a)-related kinase 1/4/5
MERQSNLRDFEVQSKLGEGAFGQVFRVKRMADGKEYALKKVLLRVCR